MTLNVAPIGTSVNSGDENGTGKSQCRSRRRPDVPHTRIAGFHAQDLGWPACMACGVGVDSWRELERCHIIDRWLGGLDGPQNLALLCGPCHQAFPDFGPGDEDAAWAWVQAHESYWDGILRRIRSQ